MSRISEPAISTNTAWLLLTFRNGNYAEPEKYPKPYCEKVLLLNEGQELPYHFHRLKEEDTINRGGGNLQITVWHSTEDEGLDRTTPVELVKDGHKLVLDPGTVVTLHPGESLTTTTGIYHKWEVEPGTGELRFGKSPLRMMTTSTIDFYVILREFLKLKKMKSRIGCCSEIIENCS